MIERHKANRRGGRIRVAFLASTLPTGGAENVTLNLFENIDRERFDVRLFFLKGAGTVGEKLLELGLPGRAHLQKRRVDPVVLVRLVRALRSYRPDILLTLNCHGNAMFWGGWASILTRVPVRIIATHHTGTHRTPRNYAGLDRLFLRSTTAILALSERHARYIRDVDAIAADKIHIIANGIRISNFESVDAGVVDAARASLGLEPHHKVVISLAGLRPEKAHDAVLTAASLLVGDWPDLRLLIVGDGPLRAELTAMCRDLHLERNVLFLGERRDIATLLHLSHVLVLPSRPVVETLPLSVMEAMAAGVPVVASTVGSVPDMIEDGVNGRLIPPADGVALAAAVRGLLGNDSEARRIREAARRTVRERYSLERMVSDYEQLFERLVG
jgi:glycosyltransferase involved in cell wall biosynthesis